MFDVSRHLREDPMIGFRRADLFEHHLAEKVFVSFSKEDDVCEAGHGILRFAI